MAKRTTMVGQRYRDMAGSSMLRSVGSGAVAAASMVAAGVTGGPFTPQGALMIGFGAVQAAQAMRQSETARRQSVKAEAMDTLIKGQTATGAMYGRSPARAQPNGDRKAASRGKAYVDALIGTGDGSGMPPMRPSAPGDQALFSEKFAAKAAAGNAGVVAAQAINGAAMRTAETGHVSHPGAQAVLDRAASALTARTRIEAERASPQDKTAADQRLIGGLVSSAKPKSGDAAPGAYINDGARSKAKAASPAGGGGQPRAAANVPTGSGPVEIPGYTRSDGTVVKGYTRQRGDR